MKNNEINQQNITKAINDFYTLLAIIPSPNGSMRCGKGSCEHYDKHSNLSGCKLFNDRRKCNRSNKQRLKSANKSRKTQYTNWYCC